jgi:hypothetical protein
MDGFATGANNGRFTVFGVYISFHKKVLIRSQGDNIHVLPCEDTTGTDEQQEVSMPAHHTQYCDIHVRVLRTASCPRQVGGGSQFYAVAPHLAIHGSEEFRIGLGLFNLVD